MITDFQCKETESLFNGQSSRQFPPDIQSVARRKLRMLNAAVEISDLRVPPGNRLEELKGKRSGEYSIRINDQWRVCFIWKDGNASQVKIEDYH